MFPSSGYFRGLDCPFYASGLCERPYCHYRHAKQSSEKDPSWIGKSTTINQKLNNHLGDTLLLDTDKGLLIEKAPHLNEVAKPFTKPTYSCTLNKDLTKIYTYKPQVALSGGEYDKANDVCLDNSKYKTYTKYNCDGVSNYQPSCDNQIRKGRYEEYSITKKKEKKVSEYNCDIASNSVPEYNPTPISELKRMHRYSTQSMTHSDLEYDPVSNFDAGFSNKSFFNLLDNSYSINQSAGKLSSGHSAYKPTRIPSDDDEEHELVIDAKFSDESDDEAASRLSEQGSDGETKDPNDVEHSFSNTAEDFNYSARILNPSYSVNYKGSGDDCKNVVSSTINKHVKTDSKSSTNEKSNKSSKTTNDVLKRHSSSEATDSNKSKTLLDDKNKLEKNKSSPDDKTVKKKKISDNDKLSSSEKKSSSDKKNLSSEKKTSTSEKKSSSLSPDKKISSSEKKVSSSSSSEKKSSGCVSSSSSKDQSSVRKDKKEHCSKEKSSAEKIRKLKESRSIPNERELNGSSSDKDRSVKAKEQRKSESDRNGRAMKERVIKVENKKCEVSSSLLVKKSSGEHRDKKKSDSQTKMDSNKLKPDTDRKKEVERRKSEGERKAESCSKKIAAVRRKSESEIKRNELEKKKDGMSCKNSLYLKRKESEKSTNKDNSLIEKVRQETLLTKNVKLQRAKELNERVEVWKANQAEHRMNPERDKITEKIRKIESSKVNDSQKNKLTYSTSEGKKSSNSTSNNVNEKSKKREHPSGENSCEHPSKKSKRSNSEQHGCSSSEEYRSSKNHKSFDLAKSSKHKISNDSVSKQLHSGVIKDKKNRSISIDDLFGEESSEDEGEESSGAFGQSGGDESTGLSDDELNVIFGDTDLSETDPYEECLRIFNESNTLIQQQQKQKQLAKAEDFPKKKEVVEPPPPLEEGKKRVAHPGAASRINDRFKKLVLPALVRPSPVQVMQNRFLEKQKRLAAESKLQKEKPLIKLPSRQLKLSLLKHKMNLPTVGNPESCSLGDRTIAGTAAKSEKRMAHMPKNQTMQCPSLVAEYGSKITMMVRRRYIKLIAEAYININFDEDVAYRTASEEESEVYKNCTSKFGYLNKAIHVIKRLRNLDTTKVTISPSVPETQNLEHLLIGPGLYRKLKTYILSEKELQENHFPRPECAGKAKFYLSDIAKSPYLPSDEMFCVRCTKSYRVNSSGKPVVDDECMYHWAKPVRKRCGNSIESRYRCCQAEPGSTGCEVAPVHVHHKNKFDGTSGYMTTPQCMLDGSRVFAMDCEMVYTTVGMEVARVTLVNSQCNVVYETFVKPAHEVLDYNTRFSGIREEDMRDVQANLIQVQAVLLHYISADTILIGHSLESDLMSLKLIHSTVIDTSVLYPHRLGRPLKRGLKSLTQDYLNMAIQESTNGHDSKEDAIAAMKLVLYQLQLGGTRPRQ